MSSVIVEFDPYSKTGNRLCQFAFGKILSQKKNVPFASQPIPGFANTYNQLNNISVTPDLLKTLQYGAHTTDYNELLTTNKTIIVNSYLQKYSYYIEHINFLRELFTIQTSENIQVDKNELVIHIRGTDYRNGNVHIDDVIYLDILNKMSPSKASLVTDDINTDIVKQLCNRGVQLITKTNKTNNGNGFNEFEVHDFLYMLKSNLLLISQSTFSWWAAFLGNQKQIIVPYNNNKEGMWKINPKKDDIDLIPNNNKFVKVIYNTK